MRLIVRSTSDDTFLVLLAKIKGNGLRIHKENRKGNFIVTDVPKMSSGVLYELLELNGILERDVKHDLD